MKVRLKFSGAMKRAAETRPGGSMNQSGTPHVGAKQLAKAKKRKGHVVTLCPKCKAEAFDVTITHSGQGQGDFGTAYWWSGPGKCLSCGYEEEYSDSSP